MSYKPKLLTISEGGSAVSTNTAYGVVCGGTTSTGPLQTLASVGTSGHVLKSAGAGALSSFSALTSKFAFTFIGTNFGNFTSGNTYYPTFLSVLNTTQADANGWFYVPFACTLDVCYGKGATVAGSNENVSIYVRINNTTDVTVTTTSQWNTNPYTFSGTGLNTAISAGSYVQLKIITPTWTAAPTGTSLEYTLGFTYTA